MRLNKKDFVFEARRHAHGEPEVYIWKKMYHAYVVYSHKSVEDILFDFTMHKTQKAKFEEKEEARKKIRELIKYWD
jgi:hypothetical protein